MYVFTFDSLIKAFSKPCTRIEGEKSGKHVLVIRGWLKEMRSYKSPKLNIDEGNKIKKT